MPHDDGERDVEVFRRHRERLPVHAIAIDPVPALERQCAEVAEQFPHATFFAGKLVFGKPSFFTRFLHNQTVAKIEEMLQLRGLHTVVLPLVATQ